MKKLLWIVPLLALMVCSIASAEPRAMFARTSAEPAAMEMIDYRISPVGFHHRGGAMEPSCGLEPSCGAVEPSCGAVEPSCGCGGEGWTDYCAPKCRKHHLGGLFRHCKRSCGYAAPSCGCDVAPSCGCEVAAPSCGCDSAPACSSCGHHHHGLFGHRGGCGSCGYGCGPVCGKFRHWSNGWCGQMIDGYATGNPPACAGDMPIDVNDAGKSMPAPAPEPMVEPAGEPAPAPGKSTRRPVMGPRFTSKPIGIGLQ